MVEVVPRKMSQLREGSEGRLSSQEGGMPVYCRTMRTPDCGDLGVGNALSPPCELIAWVGVDSDEADCTRNCLHASGSAGAPPEPNRGTQLGERHSPGALPFFTDVHHGYRACFVSVLLSVLGG